MTRILVSLDVDKAKSWGSLMPGAAEAFDPLRKDLGSPAERTWRLGQGEPRPRRTNRLRQGYHLALLACRLDKVATGWCPG
jgi:hypothetical protein